MASFLLQAQVSLVKDIYSGSFNGLYSGLDDVAVINNRLIFTAQDAVSSYSVWTTDGTSSGTQILHQLAPTSSNSAPSNYYMSNNFNRVVFLGIPNSTGNMSILTTDGTTPGLENLSGVNAVYNPIQYPAEFIDYGSNIYFNLLEASQVTGYEVYNSDGTESGTGLFKELRSGFFGGIPDHFIVYNNFLFFTSRDPTSSGREIWLSDGTNAGTNLFLDINVGTTDSNPSNFVIFNNKLYFTADNGTNGRELWVTDGTVAGTQMVLDIYPGSIGSNPTELTVYNNFLIFTANNPSLGNEIFKMTTSESVSNLKNINTGSGNSSPFGYTVFNGDLYFAADNGSGVELWKSGGFPSNTNLFANINPSGESTPQSLTEYNGKLYFNADDGTNGRELWVTDGTTIGTQIVDDIRPGIVGSDPSNLISVGSNLFFTANDGSTGSELFKYIDPILNIGEVDLENAVSIFPNPTSTTFSISINEEIIDINIYNIQGKKIKSFTGNYESYNIEELNSGIYFIEIQTLKGNTTEKLIKE